MTETDSSVLLNKHTVHHLHIKRVGLVTVDLQEVMSLPAT